MQSEKNNIFKILKRLYFSCLYLRMEVVEKEETIFLATLERGVVNLPDA